jgi:hypothetical protein
MSRQSLQSRDAFADDENEHGHGRRESEQQSELQESRDRDMRDPEWRTTSSATTKRDRGGMTLGNGRRLLQRLQNTYRHGKIDWKDFAWDVVVDTGMILGGTALFQALWNLAMPKVASAGEDVGFFNRLDFQTALFLVIMLWSLGSLLLPFFCTRRR